MLLLLLLRLKLKLKSLSHVRLFVTPWTVAHQPPPFMEFSRQQHWSGLPLPSPGDLPNPGIKPRSPALWADTLLSEPPGNPGKDVSGNESLTHCVKRFEIHSSC